MAITHNIDSIIKQMNLLEKSALPQAVEGALKDYGFYWRQFIQTDMKRTYSQTVPFTERSPYFKVKSGMGRYELLLGISDITRDATGFECFVRDGTDAINREAVF